MRGSASRKPTEGRENLPTLSFQDIYRNLGHFPSQDPQSPHKEVLLPSSPEVAVQRAGVSSVDTHLSRDLDWGFSHTASEEHPVVVY